MRRSAPPPPAPLPEPLEPRRLLSVDLAAIFTAGAAGNDLARDITADASGNTYIVGQFSGTVDFDPSAAAANLTSAAGGSASDLFVARYNSAGALAWVRQVAAGPLGSAGGVALDKAGNVLVAGRFSGSADFNPGAGVATLKSAGGTDAFVLKLSPAGNFVWARRAGGSGDDEATSVIVGNDAGRVFTTGSFARTVDFDPSPKFANFTATGASDAFAWALDSGGNYLYARRFGGSGVTRGRGIGLDGSGNLYTAGVFSGTTDFDPGPGAFRLSSAARSGGVTPTDGFVCKLNPSGKFLWASAAHETKAGVVDVARLAVDRAGNAHVVGTVTGAADFDPGAGITSLQTDSTDTSAAFVWRLNPAGKLAWARQFGGRGDGLAAGEDIALDATGNVFTTGVAAGAADFDPGVGTTAAPGGVQSVFVSELDETGGFAAAGFLPAVQSGADAAQALGRAVAVSGSSVFVAGYFNGALGYDTGGGQQAATSHGQSDFFVARFAATPPPLVRFAFSLGAESLDETLGVALDKAGNTYLVGRYSDAVDFDPSAAGDTTLFSTGLDYPDLFVAKYDTGGSLVWVRSFGNDLNNGVEDVQVDASGNVYVVGSYVGKVEFADAPDATLDSGDGDVHGTYVLKYTAAGDFVWVRGVLGDGDAFPNGLATDARGNVYVAGDFQGTADFDPGPGTQTAASAGAEDGYVLKLTAGGNFGWVKTVGGDGSDFAEDVAIDPAGNVYVCGSFQSESADFDPGPGTQTLDNPGTSSAFVLKLSPAGNYRYARAVGGTDFVGASGIAVDAGGDAYFCGSFTETADFDPSSKVLELTSNGEDDAYVAKLDAAGNLAFVHRSGGTGFDQAVRLVLDARSNVYAVGVYSDTVDFNESNAGNPPPAGGASSTLTSAGEFDAFVLKLGSGGGFRSVYGFGGKGFEVPGGVAVGAGGLVVTGSFESAGDFDPGPGVNFLTSAGGDDIFVVKLRT